MQNYFPNDKTDSHFMGGFPEHDAIIDCTMQKMHQILRWLIATMDMQLIHSYCCWAVHDDAEVKERVETTLDLLEKWWQLKRLRYFVKQVHKYIQNMLLN